MPKNESASERPPTIDASVDALLFEINAALSLQGFWRTTQKLLQRTLPHHSCSLMYGIVNEQPKGALHFLSKPWEEYRPAASMSVAGRYLVRHPQINIYTFSQVMAEDPAAYNRHVEQLRGTGASWTEYVHLAFWNGTQADAVLSIRREGDFTPADLNLLKWLYPVLNAALSRLRTLENARSKQVSLEHFINGLPVAVLFLDGNYRLTSASAEGYEACAAWNYGRRSAKTVNSRRAFRLPAEIVRACRQLSAEHETDKKPKGVVSSSGVRVQHAQIQDLVARVALAQPMRGAWTQSGFVVTFSMERNLDGAMVAEHRTALKYLQVLSQNERRVALLVAEGYSNQEIAQQLCKSKRTIECQLNAVFRKLNLSSRIQLVRLLK